MRDSNTERIGVQSVGLIVTKDLKWIFREQPIVDIGIDAFIEEVNEGYPTGKFIAVQIKSGKGNFYENSEFLVLYVSNIHYSYWLNTNIPVILVAHLPDDEKTIWEEINEFNLKRTKNQWKLNIPKNKSLNEKSGIELSKILREQNKGYKDSRIQEIELSENDISELKENAIQFSDATNNLFEILNLLNTIKEDTKNCREKLALFVKLGLDQKDSSVKKSMKIYGSLIEKVCVKLNAEIVEFAENFSIGISSYEKLVIQEYRYSRNTELLEEILISLNQIQPNIDKSISELIYLEESVNGLPKNYSHLKKSKLKLKELVNQLMEEFKTAKEMTSSFANSIEAVKN